MRRDPRQPDSIPFRILPEIDGGTSAAPSPTPLPGGLHLDDVPGSIATASGLQALTLATKRGRARTLRRKAERARQRKAAREARLASHREHATLAAAMARAEREGGARW